MSNLTNKQLLEKLSTARNKFRGRYHKHHCPEDNQEPTTYEHFFGASDENKDFYVKMYWKEHRKSIVLN